MDLQHCPLRRRRTAGNMETLHRRQGIRKFIYLFCTETLLNVFLIADFWRSYIYWQCFWIGTETLRRQRGPENVQQALDEVSRKGHFSKLGQIIINCFT